MNPLFADVKNIIDAVQATTTILAIIVGGIWSYMLFVNKRQKYPRARIEHQVACRSITKDKSLLSVDVFITNRGEVLLSLISWEISIKQMLPPQAQLQQLLPRKADSPKTTADQIIDWNLIASRKDKWKKGEFEVEPGEQHQIHSDFLIEAKVETILVESFSQNVKKRKKQMEWSLSSIHNLQPQEKENAHRKHGQ